MKLHHQLLTVAVAAALYVPAAHAEVAIDVIGGSEITFEGLVQADGNWFHNDVVDLNGGDAGNGKNSEFELRRAELVLKGKGPGNMEWVVGYDAKADKFLDTNVKYKLLGNANHFLQLGQFKQPNSRKNCPAPRTTISFPRQRSPIPMPSPAAGRRVQLRPGQLVGDRQRLRPRADPQSGPRQRLRRAWHLGPDQ